MASQPAALALVKKLRIVNKLGSFDDVFSSIRHKYKPLIYFKNRSKEAEDDRKKG